MQAAAKTPVDQPGAPLADPVAEAADDFARISSSPRSTERMDALLRLGSDAWECPTMELAADRLTGEATRTGPPPIDDRALLKLVKEKRVLLGSAAVRIVVRAAFPGDRRAQHAAAQRLRRKLREGKSAQV